MFIYLFSKKIRYRYWQILKFYANIGQIISDISSQDSFKPPVTFLFCCMRIMVFFLNSLNSLSVYHLSSSVSAHCGAWIVSHQSDINGSFVCVFQKTQKPLLLWRYSPQTDPYKHTNIEWKAQTASTRLMGSTLCVHVLSCRLFVPTGTRLPCSEVDR